MRIFKDKKGTSTVEFLICGILLFFLVFTSTDYWLIQTKIQQAQHIKNYFLDRVRVEGYLTPAAEQELRDKFDSINCDVVNIDAPSSPVLRNVDNPLSSEVWLEITVEPENKPLIFGKLLGADAPDNFTIKVSGRALSERINP